MKTIDPQPVPSPDAPPRVRENSSGRGPGTEAPAGKRFRSGSRSMSIGSEIVINMSILMIFGVILIAFMLIWIHSDQYLSAEYITYSRFFLINYIIVFAITVAVFGWRLIRKVVLVPLRELLEATYRVAAGDLSFRVAAMEDNEIGRLSAAFNEMTARLQRNQAELLGHLQEMKHLNENLTRTQCELLSSEKLASVGRLAAGVAHEIGNPLSAVAGYLDLLSRREYLGGLDREMLGRIQDEVKRINEIIRELLDYSRPQDQSVGPVDLNQSVESALTLLAGQKGFNQIELRAGLEQTPPVLANRSSITQLIMNLLINALHAMPGGGRLTISTRSGEQENQPGVELTVSDTGPGIAPELRDQIFDPFFTTKEPGQGTGLGLSICQRIVDNMKGRIWVEDGPEPGAVFKVWLPAAKI